METTSSIVGYRQKTISIEEPSRPVDFTANKIVVVIPSYDDGSNDETGAVASAAGAAEVRQAKNQRNSYRVFSPYAFHLVNFHSSGFSVESEMKYLAHEHSLRVKKVPITIRYTDPPGRPVIQQGWNVLNGVLKLTGISIMFAILGMTLFSTGVILHSVRGLLTDLMQTKGE